MSVPPRGARNRRRGQRPGWLLLSALLVLAILASATIVFTNKVELLRLAVILSLWAAVLAAFVSVAYRRQSQLDEARGSLGIAPGDDGADVAGSGAPGQLADEVARVRNGGA